MHGLIFETSICYWQDQPGKGGARSFGPVRAGGRASERERAVARGRACVRARARARKRPLPHRGGGGRASPGDRPGGGGGGAGVPARGRPRRAATPPRSPGKGGRGGALRERGERAGGRGRPGRPGPGGPRTHAPDRGGERPLRESPPPPATHRRRARGGGPPPGNREAIRTGGRRGPEPGAGGTRRGRGRVAAGETRAPGRRRWRRRRRGGGSDPPAVAAAPCLLQPTAPPQRATLTRTTATRRPPARRAQGPGPGPRARRRGTPPAGEARWRRPTRRGLFAVPDRGRRVRGRPGGAGPIDVGAHRRESSRVRRWARTPAHRWRHGTGAGGRRHTTARGPSAGRTPGPTAPGARREGRTHTRTHGRARPRRQAAGPAKALPRLAGGRRGPRQAKGGARPHRGAGGPLPPHRAGRRGGSACEPRSVACAQDEGRRLGDPAPPRHPRRRLEKTFFTEDGPSPPIAPHVGPPPGARGRPGDGRGGACGIASPPHPASPEPGSGERAGPRGGVRALGRPAGGEEVRQSLTTDRRGPAAATQPGPPPRKGDFPRHRRKQHAGPPLLPLSLASRGSRHLRDGLERSRGTAKGPLEAHRHHLGGARGTPPPPTLAARPRTRADERGRAGFRAPAPLRTTGGRGGGARGPRAEREERSHSPRMSVPRLGAARTRPGRARQHHIDRVSAGTSEEEKTPRQGCQEAGEDSPGEDPLSASPAPPGLRKGGREDPAHGERLTREARGPGGGGAGHTLASTAATAGACDKGHAGQRARGARATPPSGTGDRGEAPRLDTWTRESRRTGPRRAAQAGRSGGGRGPSVDQRLRTRPGFPSAQRESPSEESVSAPIWWPKSSVLGERKATPRGGRGPLPTASPRNCGPAIGP
ncbi:collagen alpha-1(I) chain-like [Elephas maximus indicus]|uniref:collagen alpha-1(I) chain-like n=1 Tax=Elephas maximus indicus TaxID=99487 RepID=UPI002115D7F5|nr:collagen alpha-1(I) chain-like [Elephas maximus indicus]